MDSISEANSRSESEAQGMTQEALVSHIEIRIECRTGVLQDAIGDISADERSRRRIDFNTAANFIRRQGGASSERAVERWRW